ALLPTDMAASEGFKAIHLTAQWGLYATPALHGAGALQHHLVRRAFVLRRMLSADKPAVQTAPALLASEAGISVTVDQALILAVLAAAIVMFLWGRWRHDMVALGALLACLGLGLVPAEEAFAGFGHPAVITVAAVLVLSRGLQTSGAVDMLARTILPSKGGPMLAVGSLTVLAALLSGFMNNVGALALLMPVALQVAAQQNLPAGKVL